MPVLKNLFIALPLLLSAARADLHKNSDASHMEEAANAFLQTLTSEQSAKAIYDFDHPERVNWTYLPVDRRGVALKELSTQSRKAAHTLLKTASSSQGYLKATQIIELESVLAILENNPDFRDPELYYVTIFGTPAANGTWGWRFEGHHLSFNLTIVDGEAIASAPRFMGSNPAHVTSGKHTGLRVLGSEEDLARTLLEALSDEQQAIAIFRDQPFNDIVTRRDKESKPFETVGLSYAAMDAKQKALLVQLIEEHAQSMPPAQATQRLSKLRHSDYNEIHFGWAGSPEPSQGHYYRIQGPSFLIEYDNVQKNANHTHVVWRDFDRDFGRDLLQEHHQAHQH